MTSQSSLFLEIILIPDHLIIHSYFYLFINIMTALLLLYSLCNFYFTYLFYCHFRILLKNVAFNVFYIISDKEYPHF